MDWRDPEDRRVQHQEHDIRDKMLDKTEADSFPASDPPSSIPDPSDDSFGEELPIAAEPATGARFIPSGGVESPYDRLPHADNEDAEGQPLPVSNPFDRSPQPGSEPLPDKDKAAA